MKFKITTRIATKVSYSTTSSNDLRIISKIYLYFVKFYIEPMRVALWLMFLSWIKRKSPPEAAEWQAIHPFGIPLATFPASFIPFGLESIFPFGAYFTQNQSLSAGSYPGLFAITVMDAKYFDLFAATLSMVISFPR